MVWTPARLAANVLFVLATLAPFSPAQAQPYPSRPITIVVALAAGTGADIVVRTYAEKLSQTLGRPIIIENRPGNAGLAAVDGALKALPANAAMPATAITNRTSRITRARRGSRAESSLAVVA